MDNNVTKSTFCPELFELEFVRGRLSLKQLIQQELLEAIYSYRQKHSKVNNWQQIESFLGKKVFLCPSQNLSRSIEYRCAIAFSLGNIVNSSPLSAALEIAAILFNRAKKSSENKNLTIAITVLKPGWIDFTLCDRSIAIWLDCLVKNITNSNNSRPLYELPKTSKKLDNLFPLQYIYNRCYSLLELGTREGLIVFKTADSVFLEWNTTEAFFAQWQNSLQNQCLFRPEERDLIWQICLMMDYSIADKQYNSINWRKFTVDFTQVWSNFIANCPFCGLVKQKNRDLAIARLSLIALTYWCLQNIFNSQFDL